MSSYSFKARSKLFSRFVCIVAGFAMVLALLAAGSPAIAAPANISVSTPDKWNLNLKDVDIRVFLEQVSEITGASFVVDPQVKGRVTVIASTPMNVDSVDELVLAVLRVNGLVAVPSGAITRIVPQVTGRPELSNGIATGHYGRGGNQQIVTRVIPIKNANVEEVAKVLKPLVSPAGYLEGSVYSNAIIVADYADSVQAILRSVAELDAPDTASVEAIPLREAWVGSVAPLIEALVPMQVAETGKGGSRLRIVVDENSNSLLVRGDPRQRAEIRKLVVQLDTKAPRGSDIQMISLRYADAKDVAHLLNNIIFPSQKQAGALPPAALGGIAAPPNPAVLSGLLATASSTIGAAVKQAAASDDDEQGGSRNFVQADVSLNAIVIRAEPAVINEVRALVKQLDVLHPQVLIEAAVVEITSDQTEQLGVQLAVGDAAAKLNGATTQFSSNELALGSVLTQLGANVSGVGEGLAVALGARKKFTLLLQALVGIAGANLLSTPSIMTLDNEEAKIVVGQTVPFITGTTQTLGGGGISAPFQTIDRQDVGITLKVVPQIHAGDLVQLKIEQEVSSVDTNSGIVGAADLITNKRSITTRVMAEDGQTVVLGGLIEDDLSENESHVPLLGDIPVVGYLFSNDQKTHSKRDLVVFLRPTIISTHQRAAETVQTKFARIYELQLAPKPAGHEADGNVDDLKPVIIPSSDSVFNPPARTLTLPLARQR